MDALQVLLKRGDLDDPGTKSELNAALERAKLHKECPQNPASLHRVTRSAFQHSDVQTNSLIKGRQSISSLLQLGFDASFEAYERDHQREEGVSTWADLLEAEQDSKGIATNVEIDQEKTHVSSKASVGEGDVRSNLLEFLHLHKLAPLDSEAVSEDMKHAERERTDAGQESQRITWRDPEAPESLRAFEKELEDLGNPAVQPTSSPPLSFHTVTKDHDSSSEDTYLDKLLRGEVAAPAQASAVPGLRAMGTKFAWKLQCAQAQN